MCALDSIITIILKPGGGSWERTWSANLFGGTWKRYIPRVRCNKHALINWRSVQPYSFQRLQREGCLPIIFTQMPLHYVHLGEVRSEESDRCLDTMSRKAGQKVETLEMENRAESLHLVRLGWPTAMGWGVTKYLLWPRSIRWAAVRILRLLDIFFPQDNEWRQLSRRCKRNKSSKAGRIVFFDLKNSVWMRNNCAQGEMSWTRRKPGLDEGRR